MRRPKRWPYRAANQGKNQPTASPVDRRCSCERACGVPFVGIIKGYMVRIGIIGAGGMGNAQAREFSKLEGCQVVAVCDVERSRAEALAKEYGIAGVYTDVDTLLTKADVDAVSNITPDSLHKEVALQIIGAGKHILSEKPLATNYEDAREMMLAAQGAGVINMVNFSYRSAAAIQEAKKRVDKGAVGTIRHVDATYFQSWLAAKMWGDWRTTQGWLWRLSTEHGSQGALGDIGVHILDFASYPVGPYKSVQCRLKAFDKAENNRIGDFVLDANDSAFITAEFENGALGSIQASRWATGYQNRLALKIFGDEGAIRINLDTSWTALEISSGRNIDTASWRSIELDATPNNYERFIRSIETGVNDQPDFARGAEIQKVLDACFESDRIGRVVKV